MIDIYCKTLKKIRIYMRNNNQRQNLNEVVDINGSKVFVENGKVKTILSEAIQKSGYMSVEEAKKLTLEKIRKIYELNGVL